MDAVDAVFSHNPSKVYFDVVYSAGRSITSPHLLSDVTAKLRQAFSRRLSSGDLTSVSEILKSWTTFQSEVRQIESFWKHVGLKSIEDQERDSSTAKFVEMRRTHLHLCTTLAAEVWHSQVHARVHGLLQTEIERALGEALRAEMGQKDKELFDYMRLMGQNFLGPAVRLFAVDFEGRQGRMSDSEKVECLISGTQKLSALFPGEDFQNETVRPYLEPLVLSLCARHDLESLNRLKRFLSGSLTGVYSEIVLRHFATVAIPDDFFEMSRVLSDYSSILLNDAPVKRALSNKIVHRDFQFPEKFVALLVSHWETPDRLAALASIVPLYDDQGAISTELVRAFCLRLLLKRHSSSEKESLFCDGLLKVFSIEHLRGVRSLLRDYSVSGNLIVVNTTLSMPLMCNASVAFPDDLIGPANAELTAYGRTFTNRQFRLSATFSIAYVKAIWSGNEERNLVVSVLQYRMLQMLARKEADFGKIGGSIDSITAALRSLMKGAIVAKTETSYEIAARPPKDKRINLYNAAINFRHIARSHVAQEDRDHALGLQSVIAREMKANRRVLEEELERRVIGELSLKFTVTPSEFRDVVKHMIQSEFIERDERDTRYLLYVP
jgi:hypothetical protein